MPRYTMAQWELGSSFLVDLSYYPVSAMRMCGSGDCSLLAGVFASLRQHLGPISLVAAVKIEVESLLNGGLDEIHVGTDEVRHRCGLT